MGDVGVATDDGAWHRLAGAQPRAALVMLALERQRAVNREELAELLWGEDLPDHWPGAVRGVLTKVRAFLANAGLPPTALTSASGSLQLNVPPAVTIDVEEATAAIDHAEAALTASQWKRARTSAERAVDALAGGLLPDHDAQWVDLRRARLSALATRGRHVVAAALLGEGQTAPAIAAAATLVDADPFDEAGHRLLISAHGAAGQRKAALDAYEACRRLLADELGVRPAPETEALYVAVLGDAPESAPAPAPVRSEQGGARGRPALPSEPDDLFVGRHVELTALIDDWTDTVRSAAAHVAVVEGEAGAGKTRLALAVAAHVTATSGGQVLWGRCRAGSGLPYEPVVETLGRALTDRPEAREALGAAASDLVPLLPELEEAQASPTAPAEIDPMSRARVFRAVGAALSEVVDQPTVWVIDDVQWAASDTLALLEHVLVGLAGAPLLVVVTCREVAPALAGTIVGLGRSLPCRTMTVGGLSHADLVELIAASGVTVPGDVKALARVACERTGGNPFYLNQLIRSAAQDDAPFDALAVPAALRDWIGRRVQILTKDAGTTLSLAAVIGQEVEFDTLAACSALDHLDLLDVCDQLTAEHFLAERNEPGRFAFAHALVRDAVHEGLRPTRRAWLHERVGDALELAPSVPGRAAALAHHFTLAGPAHHGRAHAHALAAGREALSQAAWDTAADHFDQGVELAGDDPDRRVTALIGLGQALRGAGRRSDARTNLEQAIGLARTHGLARRLAEAVLALVGNGGRGVADDVPDAERAALLREALAGLTPADDDLAPPVLDELALALLLTDHADERCRLVTRALRLARRGDDPARLARALIGARLAKLGPEHTEARLAEMDELLALPEAGIPADVTMAALLHRHEDLLLAGDRGGADAAIAQAETVLERYDHPYWRWAIATWRALAAIIDGCFDQAELLSFSALGHQSDHPEAMACLGVNLVDIRLFQGRSEEMVDLLASAADDNPQIPCYRAVLALCCVEAGRTDQGRAAYDHFAAKRFSNIPDDTNGLLTLGVLADVGVTLGDESGAAMLTELLLPHASRQVILNCFGGGGAYWGPVSHQLARMARLLGDTAAARRWLTQARRAAERFRSPSALARIT